MKRRCASLRTPIPGARSSASTPASSLPAAAASTASPNSNQLPPGKGSDMSQTIGRERGAATLPDAVDPAGSKHGITGKGLKGGQLGLLAVVVLGISSVAPAYSLTS